MKDLRLRERIVTLCTGIFIGMLLALPLYAQILVSWEKEQVVPIVLVKPSVAGFVPTEGTTIGNLWSKAEVKPMSLVKPSIGGFVPREGNTLGNMWSKDEVKPMIIVTPRMGKFVPANVSKAEF